MVDVTCQEHRHGQHGRFLSRSVNEVGLNFMSSGTEKRRTDCLHSLCKIKKEIKIWSQWEPPLASPVAENSCFPSDQTWQTLQMSTRQRASTLQTISKHPKTPAARPPLELSSDLRRYLQLPVFSLTTHTHTHTHTFPPVPHSPALRSISLWCSQVYQNKSCKHAKLIEI